MSIINRLEQEIKSALKARDQLRLDTVRLIKASAKNKEIELLHPLSEAEFLTVISKMVNQRHDSIEQFKKGGRPDLVEKEEKELTILQSYLPKPLSQDEVSSLIDEAVAQTKASGPKDMGVVMKALRDKVSGRFDGKLLADMVKSMLS